MKKKNSTKSQINCTPFHFFFSHKKNKTNRKYSVNNLFGALKQKLANWKKII